MSKQERYSYLTGLIDMRAFEAAQSGSGAMATCIYDAYYHGDDNGKAAWAKLLDGLRQFPDKQPATIVHLLTQKACGK